jgi:hypothetical protein
VASGPIERFEAAGRILGGVEDGCADGAHDAADYWSNMRAIRVAALFSVRCVPNLERIRRKRRCCGGLGWSRSP